MTIILLLFVYTFSTHWPKQIINSSFSWNSIWCFNFSHNVLRLTNGNQMYEWLFGMNKKKTIIYFGLSIATQSGYYQEFVNFIAVLKLFKEQNGRNRDLSFIRKFYWFNEQLQWPRLVAHDLLLWLWW